MTRYIRPTLLVVLSALLWSRSLLAQSPRPSSGGTTTRAWLGGAVGGAGNDGGMVLQWEGGVAYGLFAVGYQDSRSDNFSGGSRNEQVVFGGIQLTARRLSALLAGGVANATECLGAGDQSSYCTRSRDLHVPVMKLSADAAILPVLGVYVSTLQPLRRDIAFATYVIGLKIGKLQ